MQQNVIELDANGPTSNSPESNYPSSVNQEILGDNNFLFISSSFVLPLCPATCSLNSAHTGAFSSSSWEGLEVYSSLIG